MAGVDVDVWSLRVLGYLSINSVIVLFINQRVWDSSLARIKYAFNLLLKALPRLQLLLLSLRGQQYHKCSHLIGQGTARFLQLPNLLLVVTHYCHNHLGQFLPCHILLICVLVCRLMVMLLLVLCVGVQLLLIHVQKEKVLHELIGEQRLLLRAVLLLNIHISKC